MRRGDDLLERWTAGRNRHAEEVNLDALGHRPSPPRFGAGARTGGMGRVATLGTVSQSRDRSGHFALGTPSAHRRADRSADVLDNPASNLVELRGVEPLTS